MSWGIGRVVLVSACLVCMGSGRRVRQLRSPSQSSFVAQTSAKGSSSKCATNRFRVATALLTASDPTAAFALSGFLVRSQTGMRSSGHTTMSDQQATLVEEKSEEKSVEEVSKRYVNVVANEWETAEMPNYDYKADFEDVVLSGMRAVREGNKDILPLLEELRTKDFFSLFPFDLMAPCSYMPTEEMPCELDKCEVEPVDEVSEVFVQRDGQEYAFALDGWTRKDMPSDFTEYYDLREQLEKDTGYDGQRVWRFIHQKICFQRELEKYESGWKRDFNRAVSGMHAAVGAQILADKGLNEESRVEYHRRLRDEPGSIGNLYFAYMLTLNAISLCQDRLNNCNYLGEGENIRPTMQVMTGSELLNCQPLKQAAQRLKEHAQSPSAEEWKARIRIRDLYAIMNCVQCNLCRLHGKVMAIGLGATMQVLLGTDGRGDDPLNLDRVQVAALVATAAKFGSACSVVEQFRELDGDDMSKAFGDSSDKKTEKG